MSEAFMKALSLFLLIGIGAIAGRIGIFDAKARRGLASLVTNVAFPAVILSSMQKPFDPAAMPEVVSMLAVGTLCYLAQIALSYPLVRGGDPAARGVLRFGFCFPNVGFMGFPVVASIFGSDALFYASVFNIPFQFLAFSVGASFVSAREAGGEGASTRAFKALLNPNILAAGLGFSFFLVSLNIPEPFSFALETLGASTTPLSMLVIGATLASADLRKAFGSTAIWLVSLWRLVAFPAALYGVLYALGFRGTMLGLPVTLMAMPVAANSTILAEAGGGDAEGASALVVGSTALSLGTITALSSIFGS
jgi:hypothetical protein